MGKNSPFWRKPQFRGLYTVFMVIETKVATGWFKLQLLNVISLLNCPITTWQVNKWKTQVFLNQSQSRKLRFFMTTVDKKE